MLSLATNLTLPDESIQSKSIRAWSKAVPVLKGKQVVFSLGVPYLKTGKGKY
jgi:hypothetical protein